RKFVGGKEVASIEDRHMNVIFVRAAHNPSRTYYSQSYQEGEKIAPVCWSTDSNAPDPEVKNPQAKACNQCQWSVKGSGQGGTGKACRLQWRTAVVLPNDPAGDVMQLVIPETSCFGEASEKGRYRFKPYAQFLAGHDISMGRVITKMQFDTKSTHPLITFTPVGAVDPADIDTLKSQGSSKSAELAVKLTVYQTDESDAAPAQPAPVAAAPADDAPATEEAPEPVLRETKKPVEASTEEVPDIIKKWSKKGK
ncbi:hypothetical protein EBT31_05855, partial [bacterium]|nr:hypothetical protein [bacterium]